MRDQELARQHLSRAGLRIFGLEKKFFPKAALAGYRVVAFRGVCQASQPGVSRA